MLSTKEVFPGSTVFRVKYRFHSVGMGPKAQSSKKPSYLRSKYFFNDLIFVFVTY